MSEFVKDLAYNLGLFLCHSERDYLMTQEDESKGIINKSHHWFYIAADHIYELVIPKNLPPPLRGRLINFKRKVRGWRLTMDPKDHATEADKGWAIEEAKELLRAIDRLHGIKTEKGDWQ